MRAKFHRIESGFGFALIETCLITYKRKPFHFVRAENNRPGPCPVGGAGGGVLPYIWLIGMCRPKGYGFCAVYGLKAGVDFTSFGLNSGMVFEEMHERICRFNSKCIRKKE